MRQITLDTETTGLSPKGGHRVIEIGCVEMIHRQLTGKHFHYYLNPDRDVDKGAQAVHGLSRDFLADKPRFHEVVDDFLSFIEGAELIIHNAPFDLGFLNHELKLHDVNLQRVEKRCKVVDTLAMARKMHPGQKNNLDMLCKRYGITHLNRDLHGALLDSEILAHVYLAMTGGQDSFFDEQSESNIYHEYNVPQQTIQTSKPLVVILADESECAAHQQYLEMLSTTFS